MKLFIVFILSFGFSLVFTKLLVPLVRRLGIIDRPTSERKIHTVAKPLGGGLAVFIAFFLVLYLFSDVLLSGDLRVRHWLGFFVGAVIIMVGGLLDDKYNLKPKVQIIFPLLAALAVIAGGVEIQKITNPFGGLVYLDNLAIPIIKFGGVWHYFILMSDSFVLLWLLGMMYTTKLLDGIDGLVTGVTAIGAFIIFLFTISEKYYQPDIALASLALCGAALGFLVFNWHPARIFLGEGGSLLMGYILGVLAIISGGKIAIALLVMGIPILDVVWTIIRRLKSGQNPFTISDREHLHFRLLDLGIGQKKTVLVYYALSLIFGGSALFLQSQGKAVLLVFLVLLMVTLVVAFSVYDRSKKKEPARKKVIDQTPQN